MSSKTIWDAHGNRIGEDVLTIDRDRLTHIAHYDNYNSLVGRSYEKRDYKGEVYIIHEDAGGNRLGRSTVEQDWWGEYYVKTEDTAWARTQRRDEAKRYPERSDEDSESNAGNVGDHQALCKGRHCVHALYRRRQRNLLLCRNGFRRQLADRADVGFVNIHSDNSEILCQTHEVRILQKGLATVSAARPFLGGFSDK